mmetsp:Transcript_6679/g.9889  ORF Transcript_6679/g.9889 Transcript_6679/m.9889 type:complete len:453 (-) Transcript_6679:249-1607(-)
MSSSSDNQLGISNLNITVHVESLIKTIVRAFYPDECVCVIDVLLRDKFLRDDDMGPRLSIPVKQLRRTMEYLHREMLVKYELVDDLADGGAQQTKFWYVDYNHCVNVIRWRVFKLKQQSEKAELLARSSSMYVCPNYTKNVCNGTYSELEAQQVLDFDTGMFLCQECAKAFANHPDPPPKSSYTLEVVDSSADLKKAMETMKRINEQFSSQRVGNQQLRLGIFELLQKLRKGAKGPLSSNLPSENYALGNGSKRLDGTGRTAGIKAKKKLEQQGEFVGTVKAREGRAEEAFEYFKNSAGQEMSFIVEKGAGQKAFLLALGPRNDRLIDSVSGVIRRVDRQHEVMQQAKKHRIMKEEIEQKQPQMPSFLQNNIGKTQAERDAGKVQVVSNDDVVDLTDGNDDGREDDAEAQEAAFQEKYAKEMARQRALQGQTPALVSDNKSESEDDMEWEEG